MLFYILSFSFIFSSAKPVTSLKSKAIIGYWGSAADKPQLSQLPQALQYGYNVVCLAFGDSLTPDGGFQIHTNLGSVPTKSWISNQAGVNDDSWQYLLSFGGQNAAGPYITDIDAYVTGFMTNFEKAHVNYGFDGIDIDIETGMTTPLLKALRQIFTQLHQQGFVISMAPQPLNIDPEEVTVFMEGAYNAYVPLVDTTIIETVTYVAPQMYNNPMPLQGIESYLQSLQKGHQIEWTNAALIVNIPSSKMVFGYPAATGAAPAGPSASWESSGSSIAQKYTGSDLLMGTGGVMTWSIGWDSSNNWEFVKSVSKIWSQSIQERTAFQMKITKRNSTEIKPAQRQQKL